MSPAGHPCYHQGSDPCPGPSGREGDNCMEALQAPVTIYTTDT